MLAMPCVVRWPPGRAKGDTDDESRTSRTTRRLVTVYCVSGWQAGKNCCSTSFRGSLAFAKRLWVLWHGKAGRDC